MLATPLAWGTAPVWIPVAALVDAASGRTVLRAAVFVLGYLGLSVWGVGASLGVWLARAVGVPAARDRYLALHRALQHAWVGVLFAGLRRLFRLRVTVETVGGAPRGPLLLLSRHVSTADTLLPFVVAAIPHRLRLRVVLKRELLWDPCLDIVGQRLPNAFVQRSGLDASDDLERVRSLTVDLGERDGVVLFPEGTRATPERRLRVLSRLEGQGDPARLARARALQHVLPIRTGGVSTLLDGAPKADVVFLAHTGLEGVTRMSTLVDGTLLDRTVRVQLRRVPAAEVPADPSERAAWVHDQWAALDAWVGDAMSGG